MSNFKAKVRLISVQKDPTETTGAVSFTPVTDGCEENKSFSKYTPWGEIRLGINNAELMPTFNPTDEYIVTFTKVETVELNNELGS